MRNSLYRRLWELQILQKVTRDNFKFLYRDHPRLRRSRSDELYVHYTGCHYKELYFDGEKWADESYNDRTVSVVQPSGKISRNYIHVPYEEAPKKHRKFLEHVCKLYKQLNSQNISKLESLCKELLKTNQSTEEPVHYNIHKSLFERKILRDPIIRVQL